MFYWVYHHQIFIFTSIKKNHSFNFFVQHYSSFNLHTIITQNLSVLIWPITRWQVNFRRARLRLEIAPAQHQKHRWGTQICNISLKSAMRRLTNAWACNNSNNPQLPERRRIALSISVSALTNLHACNVRDHDAAAAFLAQRKDQSPVSRWARARVREWAASVWDQKFV